jgi:phosphoglycerate dehydrogenase-like enzyme
VLDAADRLKLYMHSAGSIKSLVPPAVFERGIVVTHGAGAIATGVADLSVCLIWMMLRQPHKMDAALKAGTAWDKAKETGFGQPAPGLGYELSGKRIGVLGAGHTGRTFIKLVRGLGCEVWVYDPYLSEERAAELGVIRSELDDLLSQCPIVSCQLPTTEETHHMIGARELGLLQDGAILTNTARSWVMDQDALLAELQSGRIQAALDVFDQEPLPADSPFLKLDNVILTPHVAGGTIEARHRQGQYMVEELRRFLAGEPLRFQVTKDMLPTMA